MLVGRPTNRLARNRWNSRACHPIASRQEVGVCEVRFHLDVKVSVLRMCAVLCRVTMMFEEADAAPRGKTSPGDQ
jgi:hypothetical protein